MINTRLGDQVKKSGAFCTYVALATAVLHCLGWMTVAPERDEAGLGPVHVRKYRYWYKYRLIFLGKAETSVRLSWIYKYLKHLAISKPRNSCLVNKWSPFDKLNDWTKYCKSFFSSFWANILFYQISPLSLNLYDLEWKTLTGSKLAALHSQGLQVSSKLVSRSEQSAS